MPVRSTTTTTADHFSSRYGVPSPSTMRLTNAPKPMTNMALPFITTGWQLLNQKSADTTVTTATEPYAAIRRS